MKIFTHHTFAQYVQIERRTLKTMVNRGYLPKYVTLQRDMDTNYTFYIVQSKDLPNAKSDMQGHYALYKQKVFDNIVNT